MAEYQNIFTQVQVKGPPEMGMDETGELSSERTKTTRNNTWLGYLGNAQLGPIHLGMFGVVSIYLFFVWFFEFPQSLFYLFYIDKINFIDIDTKFDLEIAKKLFNLKIRN